MARLKKAGRMLLWHVACVTLLTRHPGLFRADCILNFISDFASDNSSAVHNIVLRRLVLPRFSQRSLRVFNLLFPASKPAEHTHLHTMDPLGPTPTRKRPRSPHDSIEYSYPDKRRLPHRLVSPTADNGKSPALAMVSDPLLSGHQFITNSYHANFSGYYKSQYSGHVQDSGGESNLRNPQQCNSAQGDMYISGCNSEDETTFDITPPWDAGEGDVCYGMVG